MHWAIASAAAIAAVATLGRGAVLVLRGRRRLHDRGAGPEDRMVASLRVAAGIRKLNLGAVLLVLAGVVAYLLP